MLLPGQARHRNDIRPLKMCAVPSRAAARPSMPPRRPTIVAGEERACSLRIQYQHVGNPVRIALQVLLEPALVELGIVEGAKLGVGPGASG